MKALQTIQLKAARSVTGHDRFASTREVLRQCGWLSVRQLTAYHTLLLLRNVMKNKSPVALYKMFDDEYCYNTRQAASGKLKCHRKPKLELIKKSFGWRAVELCNRLPEDIRSIESTEGFKKKAKEWIRNTISI